MAEIWKEEEAALGAKLVTRNCAKDPQVKPWVQDRRKNLQQVGIPTIKELQSMLSNVNDLLQENGEAPFAQAEYIGPDERVLAIASLEHGAYRFCVRTGG
jgi:hypothetical protein